MGSRVMLDKGYCCWQGVCWPSNSLSLSLMPVALRRARE